ncbi:MAG: ThuA domain-containing protein [Phycisphaerae bacterium]|nr:ThuA domain-containing protein [Phycisphaerae bacterium]
MLLRLFASVSVVCWTASCLAAGDGSTKILLIGKDRDHPYTTHEYMAECALLGKCLEQTAGVRAVVSNGWPKDPAVLEGVGAIVFYTKQAGNVLLDPKHRAQAEALLAKGVGLSAIHWATGAEGDEVGQRWMKALGGWFNSSFSKLKFAKLEIRQPNPDHPICRGWRPYELHDEYYLALRFAEGVTPVMTVQVDGTEYVVGWAYERAGSKGGRSFGCVLGHFHKEFGLEAFRRSLVNGILWTARREIPAEGAPCTVSEKDLALEPDARLRRK